VNWYLFVYKIEVLLCRNFASFYEQTEFCIGLQSTLLEKNMDYVPGT